jgi:hypothetical protein
VRTPRGFQSEHAFGEPHLFSSNVAVTTLRKGFHRASRYDATSPVNVKAGGDDMSERGDSSSKRKELKKSFIKMDFRKKA